MATRNLKMHKKLLLDVIRRQAGSLQKSFLEAIMNGIEAGCTKVCIDFREPGPDDGDTAFVTITDDGKGITNKQEIENFFETFGTPHDESENKIWAQFRMGRGQLFSFGKNKWRTTTFQMEIDIDGNGLQYDLTENLPHKEGCQIDIELYTNPIGTYRSYASVNALKDSIKEQIEFISVPVYFNGDLLTTHPSKCKWTYEDEDAYYLWGTGSDLTIYNMGAFVKKLSAMSAGVTGVVVSKSQLKVNFARNDIQSDCEVSQRINAVIKKNRKTKVRKAARRLDDFEKVALLRDIRDGEQNWTEVKNLRIVPTANDRYVSLSDVAKITQLWSFADGNDMAADRLMVRKAAMVFNEKIYKQLGYSGELKDFWTWLLGSVPEWQKRNNVNHLSKLYRKMYGNTGNKGLADDMSSTTHIFANKDLTVPERRILRILNKQDWAGRVISIGQSDMADAWTDGKSYIVINRDFLKKCGLPYDADKIVMLLIHEICHDGNTAESHVHGEEFYRTFHDVANNTGWNRPTRRILTFHNDLRRAKINMQIEKQKAKEEKEKAARDKKLGIKKAVVGVKTVAARKIVDSSVTTPAEVVAEKIDKKKVTPNKQLGRFRIPNGAK